MKRPFAYATALTTLSTLTISVGCNQETARPFSLTASVGRVIAAIGFSTALTVITMRILKRQLTNWFHENFDQVREGDSGWTIQPKSCQGCLLVLLVILPIVFVSFGWTIFLLFKIYPILLSTLMTRLGIAPWLGLPLLITACFGCYLNLPLFILLARRHSESHIKFELLPLLLFKCWFLPLYVTQYDTCGYVGINVSGALIPIILALYQFHRAPPIAILIVTAIVALFSYFLVTVKPGEGIVTGWSKFWLITLVAALTAMGFGADGVNRFDVSVAFAGAVLGTTIGADLLHLKDVHPEAALSPLSIGGAGLDDGIAQSGLCALIIAEWFPAVPSWLSAYF